MALASSVTRSSTGVESSAATSRSSAFIPGRSGRDADERQRLGELEEDWPADFGAEGFAVEDHLGAFPLDADLVAFLEVHAADARVAELAGQRGEKRPQQGCRPLLDRHQPQCAALEALQLA